MAGAAPAAADTSERMPAAFEAEHAAVGAGAGAGSTGAAGGVGTGSWVTATGSGVVTTGSWATATCTPHSSAPIATIVITLPRTWVTVSQ